MTALKQNLISHEKKKFVISANENEGKMVARGQWERGKKVSEVHVNRDFSCFDSENQTF